MGRGRAIRVTGSPDRGAVIAKTKELIDFARRHGVSAITVFSSHLITRIPQGGAPARRHGASS